MVAKDISNNAEAVKSNPKTSAVICCKESCFCCEKLTEASWADANLLPQMEKSRWQQVPEQNYHHFTVDVLKLIIDN